MSFPTWLVDASANRTNKSYLQGFLDISGNLYLRNSSIMTPMNTITFNDTTGFVNFGNSYFGSAVYIYNPTTLSNIDVVAYVNTNNSNITTINSNISTANSNIATNTSSITTINGKIGTLNYDNIYDFTTVNNLFINPGGVLQYEDALGNHPDLIAAVISNTSNITSNTSNITTLTTKLTNQTYTSGTNTTSWTGNISFPATSIASTSINNSSFVDLTNTQTIGGTKTFSSAPNLSGAGISSSSINAGAVVGTAMVLTGAQTAAGIKTFSSPPVMSGASITSGTIPIASVVGTAMDLTTAQTVAGIKTFSSPPVMSGASITSATIPIASVVGTAVALSGSQTITGQKTFSTSAPIITTNLRLDGSLLVGTTGGTTITNTQLTYLSTLSSNVQTQLSSMISLSANNTYTGTQTYNNTITFTSTLNSVSATTFGYISGLTSSAQTQIDNKANLGAFNNFTAGCQFSNQLVGLYNASGTIIGSQTELFFTGHRPWTNGTPSNGDNIYEMSLDTGFYNRGATFQGGSTNTLSGTGMKSCFGLYYRTYISGGTDPTRTPIMYGTDTETGSINNTLVIPSSLRVDGSLLVNSGGTTITNTQLGYLSTLSANVQSSINTLATKLTDITWTAGSPNVTSIVNTTQTATLTFSGTLNNVSSTVFGYISGLTSSAQTQLTSLSSSITTINSKLPVGMIIQHPKNNLASPYLLCNGAAVSRSTYSALFTSIGTLYGVGDGSTTFNLPNFQACFLRGAGTQAVGGTTYTAGSVGTPVNDSIIGHTHSGQSGQFLTTSTSSATVNGYASIAVVKPTASNFGTTGGVSVGGGAETAPVHHVIYYYILAL